MVSFLLSAGVINDENMLILPLVLFILYFSTVLSDEQSLHKLWLYSPLLTELPKMSHFEGFAIPNDHNLWLLALKKAL